MDDPGGHFASDAHRRVLAHLPAPAESGTDVEALLERMAPDASTDFTEEAELAEVLKDLEADGHATEKGGWKMTKSGFKLLTGPNAEES